MYVNTDEEVMYIFTKALGVEKLWRFRAMLGVQELGVYLKGECCNVELYMS